MRIKLRSPVEDTAEPFMAGVVVRARERYAEPAASAGLGGPREQAVHVARQQAQRSSHNANYYAGVPPEARLRAAMHHLYVAARAQLGVSNPKEVAPDEPIDPRQAS
jgi:hypothetical protein